MTATVSKMGRSLLTRSVERARYAGERRRQLGAKPLNNGDDGHGDTGRDQSILDGSRT